MSLLSMTPPPQALLENLDWVRRLAARLVADAHRAEDVAQAALFEALKKPPEFVDDAPRLRRWLGGIVRHEARNTLGREGDRPWREERAARPEAVEAARTVETLETHRRLVEALESLSEADRDRLVWHYFDGVRVKEIARREGATPETTRKRLERARARLRERLDSRYGGREAWCGALLALAKTQPIRASLPVAKILGALLLAISGLGVLLVLRGEPAHAQPSEALSPAGLVAALPEPAEVEAAAEAELEAERAVIPPAVKRAPHAVVEVYAQEDRSPLPGATVIARLASGETWMGETDSFGFCELPRGAANDWIAAGCEGRVAHALSPAGRTNIGGMLSLSRARTLSGSVHGIGSDLRGKTLPLTTHRDPLASTPPWLANGLERAGVPGRVPHHIPVDETGRFLVDGLASDWAGRLHAPQHHWFGELPEALHRVRRDLVELRSPQDGLVIQAVSLPQLFGTVVDSATEQPLGLANIRLVPFIEGDSRRRTFSVQSRADGSFLASYGPGSLELEQQWTQLQGRPRVERVELSIEREGYHTLRRVLPGGNRVPSGALGELRLEPSRPLEFYALDAAAQPLAGSMVFQKGVHSRPAKADGQVRLHAPLASLGDLVLAAPGHRRRPVPLSVGGQLPEQVTLAAGGELQLRFESPDQDRGLNPESLRVELRCAEPPFAGAEAGDPFPVPLAVPAQGGFRPALAASADSADLLSPWGAHAWVMDVRLDRQGRARLSGFDPGLALEVVVKDGLQRIIGRASGRTPRGAEPLELVVRSQAKLAELRGRILDESGQPIPRGIAYVQAAAYRERLIANAEGEFQVGTFSAGIEGLCVDVSAPGFATRRWSGMSWSPGGSDLVFALQPARPLFLQLLESDGRPSRLVSLVVEGADGVRESGRLESQGRFSFSAMGAGELLVRASLSGRTYRFSVPAGISDSVLRLPVLADMELRLPAIALRQSVCSLRISGPLGPEQLSDPEAAREVSSLPLEGSEPTLDLRLPPGTYRLQLLVPMAPNAPRAAQRCLGKALEVEVLASQRVRAAWPN